MSRFGLLLGLALALSCACAGYDAIGKSITPIDDVYDMIKSGRSAGVGKDGSLAGVFDIEGCKPEDREIACSSGSYKDGAWTTRRIIYKKPGGISAIEQNISFLTIPGDGIGILVDHAVAISSINVKSQEGLRLRLPNDKITAKKHEITSPTGKIVLKSGGEIPISLGMPWVNIDNRMSLVALSSNSPFVLKDMPGCKASRDGCLLINLPFDNDPHEYHPNGLVRYSVAIMATGNARRAANLHKNSRLISSGNPDVKCAVIGADGKRRWVIGVNVGTKPAHVETNIGGRDVVFEIGPMSMEVKAL